MAYMTGADLLLILIVTCLIFLAIGAPGDE